VESPSLPPRNRYTRGRRESGLRIPAGDIDALAQALLKILQDEPLRMQMSLAARAVAEANSWDRAATGFIQLCHELPTNLRHIVIKLGLGLRNYAMVFGPLSRSLSRTIVPLLAMPVTLSNLNQEDYGKLQLSLSLLSWLTVITAPHMTVGQSVQSHGDETGPLWLATKTGVDQSGLSG